MVDRKQIPLYPGAVVLLGTLPNGGRRVSRTTVPVDVMDRNLSRCIVTLEFPFNPIYRLRLEEILDFVYKKRPTLRHEMIAVLVGKIPELLT